MDVRKWAFKIAVVALVLTVLPWTAAISAEKVINLRFASYFPPQAMQSKLCEDFVADVEARTDGRVKIQFFPGGALAKAPEIIKSIETGIADIGFSHVAYTAGRFPVTEVLELPHGYATGWVANQIMNDFYNQFKPKEWDSVVPLWFHANAPSVLATTKAIRTLEDFKGLSIRATGRQADVIRALGGNPTPTAMPEVYDAIAKNVIHGTFVGMEGVKSFRLGEVTKFITNSWNVGPSYPFYVAMSKNGYAKLPADILPIFNKLCGEYKERFCLTWNAADFPGQEFGIQQGVEIIELPQAEFDRWIQAVQPVFEAYVKEMVSKKFDEAQVRSWFDFIQKRKAALLEKQIMLQIMSTQGPPPVRR